MMGKEREFKMVRTSNEGPLKESGLGGIGRLDLLVGQVERLSIRVARDVSTDNRSSHQRRMADSKTVNAVTISRNGLMKTYGKPPSDIC